MILNDRKRLDGRGTEDIRQLEKWNRYFTLIPHGSALFDKEEKHNHLQPLL
jgi:polyribonucleotide nucleotidyltransferase